MKPAVLSQATDKADALWHYREIYDFKTYKLKKGEKNNREESLGQKTIRVFPYTESKHKNKWVSLGYNLSYLWLDIASGPTIKMS